MATVPNPRTWTVGELLTAAKLNTDLRDGLNFLLASPRAQLYKTAPQSTATGTFTTLSFDAEVIDSDGAHSTSTNNSRFTAQTSGWYQVSASIHWNPDSTAGFRMTTIDINNSGTPQFFDMSVPMSDNSLVLNPCGMLFLNVGDYVEVKVYQNSGASRNVSGTLTGTHIEYFWRSK